MLLPHRTTDLRSLTRTASGGWAPIRAECVEVGAEVESYVPGVCCCAHDRYASDPSLSVAHFHKAGNGAAQTHGTPFLMAARHDETTAAFQKRVFARLRTLVPAATLEQPLHVVRHGIPVPVEGDEVVTCKDTSLECVAFCLTDCIGSHCCTIWQARLLWSAACCFQTTQEGSTDGSP